MDCIDFYRFTVVKKETDQDWSDFSIKINDFRVDQKYSFATLQLDRFTLHHTVVDANDFGSSHCILTSSIGQRQTFDNITGSMSKILGIFPIQSESPTVNGVVAVSQKIDYSRNSDSDLIYVSPQALNEAIHFKLLTFEYAAPPHACNWSFTISVKFYK